MLAQSVTAVVARNETWSGSAASEPYEAAWAREAIVFVRALRPPVGRMPPARVEISPDGIHWVAEGTTVALPGQENALSFARVVHFGGWLRLAADFEPGSEITLLATLVLKA